jgi:acyl-CoA thioester hydrolase
VTLPINYDLPTPHLLELGVEDTDIDAYNHVNNAVYVTWCDRAAWNHSTALGLPLSRCLEMDRGMAVLRTVISYLRPAVLGDSIVIATWLLPSDRKLCTRRRFQFVRPADGATLIRAEIEYVCIELSSGRPTRWPPEFKQHYIGFPDVIAAYAQLPAL